MSRTISTSPQRTVARLRIRRPFAIRLSSRCTDSYRRSVQAERRFATHLSRFALPVSSQQRTGRVNAKRITWTVRQYIICA